MSTNDYFSRGGGRTPGPIGVTAPLDTLRSHSLWNRAHADRPQPVHEHQKCIQILGPYPRLTVTEGYVTGRPGGLEFQNSSRQDLLESYKGFANGHSHTEVIFAPHLPSNQGSYEMTIPSSLSEVNLNGRMHYRVPAGSEVFTATIPFKERGYTTEHYRAEIDAIKSQHPNALILVQVHSLKNPRVEILGFDPSSSEEALVPGHGREVIHLYSNSAYSSLQSGTLGPLSGEPSGYSGERFGAFEEISHRNASFAPTLSRRLEQLTGQEVGLKINAWKSTERERMIPPSTSGSVTNGVEIAHGGSSPFYYLDSINKVQAHTIPIKVGETFSWNHPALVKFLSDHPTALHMCRVETDYNSPGYPKRVEIVSIE